VAHRQHAEGLADILREHGEHRDTSLEGGPGEPQALLPEQPVGGGGGGGGGAEGGGVGGVSGGGD